MSNGHRSELNHAGDSHGSQCENRAACEKPICDRDRRRLLGALAAGGAASLAGCTGLFSAPETDPGDPVPEHSIEYLVQEATIDVKESQTLLGAAEDEGYEMDYDCRAGFCGVCLSQADGDATELVEMVVNDVDALTEEAVEAGYFLPCTSKPRDSFQLDSSVNPGDLQQFADEDDEDDETDDDDEQVGTFHTATYLNEQWSIQVPEDKNLLVAGEEVGLDLPYSCRVGVCGQCLAQTDGDASEKVEMTDNDYGPLDDGAIQDGYFLTCTAQPRADLDIETEKFGEL